jgi:hypothetical protein
VSEINTPAVPCIEPDALAAVSVLTDGLDSTDTLGFEITDVDGGSEGVDNFFWFITGDAEFDRDVL